MRRVEAFARIGHAQHAFLEAHGNCSVVGIFGGIAQQVANGDAQHRLRHAQAERLVDVHRKLHGFAVQQVLVILDQAGQQAVQFDRVVRA
ncbi:hypothetical protein APX70_200029 [Pseudomonas syringae pv. maculicola]|uniref:Uncharacterized protein n=1 Tax=Pseudomonas syringae pv. maculicola TaxID=59511 RepID=A0A3M2YIG4_PSEYM|nr:hypothetical protein APX70_200029 [Pseudomonas syringae pv. maculicola]